MFLGNFLNLAAPDFLVIAVIVLFLVAPFAVAIPIVLIISRRRKKPPPLPSSVESEGK